MFYFKDEGIPPSDIDIEQFTKVQKFKTSISKEFGALYHNFDSTDDFRNKVRLHLNKVVQIWVEKNKVNLQLNTESIKIDSQDTNNPLSNITALDENDYEEDIIDLSETVAKMLEDVTSITLRINQATEKLGKNFNDRAKEIEAINLSNDVTNVEKLLKKSSNSAANDFENYVSSLSIEISNYHEKHQLVMETFGNIAMIASNDLDNDIENTEVLKGEIIEYKNTFPVVRDSLNEFRESIYKMPRMTSAFNRGKRRSIAIIDGFLAQLKIAETQTIDVIELLE